MSDKRPSDELDEIKALGEEYARLLPDDSFQLPSDSSKLEQSDELDADALAAHYQSLIATNTLTDDSSQPTSDPSTSGQPGGLDADVVAAHYRSIIAANTRMMPGVLTRRDGSFIVGVMMHIINSRGLESFLKVLPKLLIGAVGGLVGVGLLYVLTPLVLGAVGFGTMGPLAGSLAAAIQATIGNVAAGSLFAICQSIAMGGAIPVLWTVIAAAVGIKFIAPKLERFALGNVVASSLFTVQKSIARMVSFLSYYGRTVAKSDESPQE